MNVDLSAYQKNGYLHFNGFFEPKKLERIRNEAQQIFIRQMRRQGLIARNGLNRENFERALFEYFKRDLQGFMNCGKQAQHLISLHRLGMESKIEETLQQLGLRFPNICTRPVLFFNSRHLAKKEVYWRVFAHQDWRSMQGSLDAVVVWVPLMNVNRDLGALEIVPGSHRLGLLTTEVVDSFGKVDRFSDADFNPVEVEIGDALFFSSFLVHRSGVNSTHSIRWSCHFRYNNLDERTFVERGYPHPYIYKPDEALITANFPDSEAVSRIFAMDEDKSH